MQHFSPLADDIPLKARNALIKNELKLSLRKWLLPGTDAYVVCFPRGG
jgi:hypothetical protein